MKKVLSNAYVMLGILAIFIIIGGTYALFRWNAPTTDVAVTVGSVKILYVKGPEIIDQTLKPTFTKEEGLTKEIKASLDRSPEAPVTLNFYLDIITLPEELKHITFKWELYKNDELVNNNNFLLNNEGQTLNLTTGQYVTTTKDTYKLYIWIDANEENPYTMGGQAFSFKLRADGQNAMYEEVDYATPASCFAFTPATKTITRYYNNQDDNASNPLCPKDVVIPEKIKGVDVEVLADGTSTTGVFYQSNITSLELPSTLITIGNYAVYQNKLSGTLTIPKSVQTIGICAFTGNSGGTANQLTSIVFEYGSILENIGNRAFEYNKLSGTLTIPKSVKTIEFEAFYSNQLTSLVFESDSILENIGNRAFANNKLSTLTIPKSVKTIEAHAFYGSASGNQLTSLVFESGSILESIRDSAFMYNKLSTLTIPKSVKIIEGNAFFQGSITSVIFESGSILESIMDKAFQQNKLTSFTIPATVTSLGYGVLSYNATLTTIVNKTGREFQWCGTTSTTGVIDYQNCSPNGTFITGQIVFTGTYARTVNIVNE